MKKSKGIGTARPPRLMALKTATLRLKQATAKFDKLIAEVLPTGTKIIFPINGEFVLGEVRDRKNPPLGCVFVKIDHLLWCVPIDSIDLQ